jgi:hypothetical protein
VRVRQGKGSIKKYLGGGGNVGDACSAAHSRARLEIGNVGIDSDV